MILNLYQVAYADNTCDLAEMVSAMMMDGWTPQGGICVMVDPTGASRGETNIYGYYQAMVRPTS